MALTKVNYVDHSTGINAKNLNDIQDAIIALEENTPSPSPGPSPEPGPAPEGIGLATLDEVYEIFE